MKRKVMYQFFLSKEKAYSHIKKNYPTYKHRSKEFSIGQWSKTCEDPIFKESFEIYGLKTPTTDWFFPFFDRSQTTCTKYKFELTKNIFLSVEEYIFGAGKDGQSYTLNGINLSSLGLNPFGGNPVSLDQLTNPPWEKINQGDYICVKHYPKIIFYNIEKKESYIYLITNEEENFLLPTIYLVLWQKKQKLRKKDIDDLRVHFDQMEEEGYSIE